MKPIIFIDSGDTLVDEGTEIRDIHDVVVYAELIPGARDLLLTLKEQGYRVVLVADGLKASFDNIYRLHRLEQCFDARAVSETVGAEKPDARMFQTAMDALGLKESDKQYIYMVGNNIKKDIVGANRFGIISVLETWSKRYSMVPETEEEQPDIMIREPLELLPYLKEADLYGDSKCGGE